MELPRGWANRWTSLGWCGRFWPGWTWGDATWRRRVGAGPECGSACRTGSRNRRPRKHRAARCACAPHLNKPPPFVHLRYLLARPGPTIQHSKHVQFSETDYTILLMATRNNISIRLYHKILSIYFELHRCGVSNVCSSRILTEYQSTSALVFSTDDSSNGEENIGP